METETSAIEASSRQFLAVSNVVIENLASGNDGNTLAVHISRDDYNQLQIIIHERYPSIPTPILIPIDAISGSSANTTLHIKLGERIDDHQEDDSERHVNHVYDVEVLNSDQLNFKLPPLVLKLAHEREGRKLAEEAAVYSYLSSLQGTVIPRCYGYFRRFVDLMECVVHPWIEPGTKAEFPRTSFDEFRMPNSHASLSILLLEKLPGHIEKSADLGSLRASLIAMNEELSLKQVLHEDLHYRNVMRCSDTTESTASSYQYRLIDLEDAIWSNFPRAVKRRGYEKAIDDIIDEVRKLD